MTNTLTRQITVKNINTLLQGNIFKTKNQDDYPYDDFTIAFGQEINYREYNLPATNTYIETEGYIDASDAF